MTLLAVERLTLSQARRITLRAQGLDRPRPVRAAEPTMRHFQQVVDRLGVLQIDSVNVLARAHLLPVFSRVGPYDPALLLIFTPAQPQDRLALQHVHGLVFHVVVLAAQDVPRFHVQNLPDVAVGPRPDELVAPGLLHPVRNLRHRHSWALAPPRLLRAAGEHACRTARALVASSLLRGDAVLARAAQGAATACVWSAEQHKLLALLKHNATITGA